MKRHRTPDGRLPMQADAAELEVEVKISGSGEENTDED